MVGQFGFLNSFASVDMDLAWKCFNAGQDLEHATLVKLTCMYMELSDALEKIDRPMMDSAMDKAIERVADHRFPNRLYPPYEGLTEEEFRQVDADMKAVLEKYRKQF